MTPEVEESEFVSWSREELNRAGMFDTDSDYGGMLGDEIMKMVETFSEAGHSGFSANYAAMIFGKLVRREALTPIGDRSDEWMHIAEETAGQPDLWQSRRQSSCFSNDRGLTYYDIDEDQGWWRKLATRILRRQVWRMHESVPMPPSLKVEVGGHA